VNIDKMSICDKITVDKPEKKEKIFKQRTFAVLNAM